VLKAWLEDRLPPDEAERLENLVHDSDFFNLPPVIVGRKPLAENFQYDIIVRTEQDFHAVEIREGEPPEKLKPLIDWLTGKAESILKINFELMQPDGPMLTAIVSSEDLPAEDVTRLRDFITQSDFFNLPDSTAPEGQIGPRYRIRAEACGVRHTVETNDSTMPQALRPLVEFLVAEANRAIWVDFKRSGGISGTRIAETIDSRNLSDQDAGTLRELIDLSNFFGLPPKICAREPVPDSFQYEISILAGSRSHKVIVCDEAGPTELHNLIDWLNDKALEDASGDGCCSATVRG
jgi:hypothetical protein